MILYRYLNSHWLDTLRDSRFMISKPSRFRNELGSMSDKEDVMPHLEGDIPPKVMQRSFPFKAIRPVEWSKAFSCLFNTVLSRDETFDRFLRVLCFSDAHNHPMTDRYMWKSYAGNFSGVRLGMNFELTANEIKVGDNRMKAVSYKDNPGEIQANKICAMEDIFDMVWEILATKNCKYDIEREWRLLALTGNCVFEQELWFLSFDKRSVSSVDIGCKMDMNDQISLLEIIRENYPHIEVSEAWEDGTADSVIYRSLLPSVLRQ